MQKFNELEGKDVTAVQLNRLSTSFNKGITPDNKWFGERSSIYTYLSRVSNPKTTQDSMLKFLFEGKAGNILKLIGGVISGNVFSIVSAYVGNATGEAISSFVRWGGQNIALFKAGAAVGISGLAAVAAGLITGTSPLQILRGLLNFTDIVYEFNFDTPDSQVWSQIKSAIDSLYGQAGDFLGSSFARLLLVGALSPPKIEIDINGISLALSEFSEERQEDLLNGISNFAWTGIRTAQRITFLFAFLNGRKAIRDLANSSPAFRKMIDKGFPGLGKALQGWGDEEDPNTKESEIKDWKISTYVENKLEGVKKAYGPQIGNFVEQFVEGFSDELRDGLEEYIEWKFV